MNRRTYYFTGHVQGVGFRYTARYAAAGFRVTGFVRNLADGRVEMVLEGPEEEMDGVVDRLTTEMRRNISQSTCDASPATGEFKSFDIRH